LSSDKRNKSIYFVFKRAMDFLGSLLALIVLSPAFPFIALAIKLDSKGPVLFTQKRVGKGKSHFQIYKFRTMKIDAPKDAPTHLLENPDIHITKVGRMLRKTSLDELPQLINIVKGEMSFVGPRPALWNQYDLIDERDKYGANNFRPGLTGLAQISGRDELTIEDKAKLDGEYVEKIRFLMDAGCVFGTIYGVISSTGVVEGVIATKSTVDTTHKVGGNATK
jgi:O-antigen biosynthesis protein WbqP